MARVSNNPRLRDIELPLRPGTTPLPFPAQRISKENPLVLWHLLSLDAPTVAALWTWFLASANHVRLPLTSILAMATAVWLLYAADRLLDSRVVHSRGLEARHRFHHRHRRAFLAGITAASVALAALLPSLSPESIRLYLIEGSVLVGYFVLIHATSSAHRLPKELAVGLFFAAATFIPTISRQPALRLPLIAPAILFAALCSLNCLFIYAWEHSAPAPGHLTEPATHPATRIALHHLRILALVLLLAAFTLALFYRRAPWPIPFAIALSTGTLLLLHHYRRAMPATALRAAADVALLTPLLFLGIR